jgi:excinuclease ABC subunit C
VEAYGLSIPVFGIVKDNKHRTEGLISKAGKIDVDKSSDAFMLLTNIQDEMHRRAITYHRSLRQGSALKTELREIKGVGEKKAKLLLKAFRSVKRIKDATYEEIEAVEGIDKNTAKNVFTYFNGR